MCMYYCCVHHCTYMHVYVYVRLANSICFLLNLLISTCSEVHPRDSDEDLVSPQLPQDPRTRKPALHPERNGYDQKRSPSDNSTPSMTPNQPVHSMHLDEGRRRRYGTVIFNFCTLHMELGSVASHCLVGLQNYSWKRFYILSQVTLSEMVYN